MKELESTQSMYMAREKYKQVFITKEALNINYSEEDSEDNRNSSEDESLIDSEDSEDAFTFNPTKFPSLIFRVLLSYHRMKGKKILFCDH